MFGAIKSLLGIGPAVDFAELKKQGAIILMCVPRENSMVATSKVLKISLWIRSLRSLGNSKKTK